MFPFTLITFTLASPLLLPTLLTIIPLPPGRLRPTYAPAIPPSFPPFSLIIDHPQVFARYPSLTLYIIIILFPHPASPATHITPIA
jgi:hypothetical protein